MCVCTHVFSCHELFMTSCSSYETNSPFKISKPLFVIDFTTGMFTLTYPTRVKIGVRSSVLANCNYYLLCIYSIVLLATKYQCYRLDYRISIDMAMYKENVMPYISI